MSIQFQTKKKKDDIQNLQDDCVEKKIFISGKYR